MSAPVAPSLLKLELPVWELPGSRPLVEQLPRGRLIEITTRAHGAGQMTLAVACLAFAQACGETTAWVQLDGGALYPPDLADSGIDLESLVVVAVPTRAGSRGLAKAAELLLRSSGFGMVVIDLQTSAAQARGRAKDAGLPTAVLSRLLGLAREHASWVILLSDAHETADTRATHSLGPLINISIRPQRERIGRGEFTLQPLVKKDKSGALGSVSVERRRGPWGLS